MQNTRGPEFISQTISAQQGRRILKSFLRTVIPWPVYKFLSSIRHEIFLLFGYRGLKTVSLNYDQHWEQRVNHLIPERRIKKFVAIRKLIERGSSILDVGCGDGVGLEILLKDNIASAQSLGIDISEVAVRKCKQKGLNAKQVDISNTSFADKLPVFDYIILADVIEHIPNPEELLLALKGNFRKGIVVTVPNTGFLRHRLRLLFGKFPMQWDVYPGKHLRFWTYKDFLWWLGQLGFGKEKFIPVLGIPFLKRVWPNLFCDVMLFLLNIPQLNE